MEAAAFGRARMPVRARSWSGKGRSSHLSSACESSRRVGTRPVEKAAVTPPCTQSRTGSPLRTSPRAVPARDPRGHDGQAGSRGCRRLVFDALGGAWRLGCRDAGPLAAVWSTPPTSSTACSVGRSLGRSACHLAGLPRAVSPVGDVFACPLLRSAPSRRQSTSHALDGSWAWDGRGRLGRRQRRRLASAGSTSSSASQRRSRWASTPLRRPRRGAARPRGAPLLPSA